MKIYNDWLFILEISSQTGKQFFHSVEA